MLPSARCKGAKQIGTADNSDDAIVAHDRNSLDPISRGGGRFPEPRFVSVIRTTADMTSRAVGCGFPPLAAASAANHAALRDRPGRIAKPSKSVAMIGFVRLAVEGDGFEPSVPIPLEPERWRANTGVQLRNDTYAACLDRARSVSTRASSPGARGPV